MEVGRFLGLERSWEYIPLVNGVFCAISLALPLGIYRLGQRIMQEEGAIFAFLLGLFWWHFLFFAHKPMPGILATYALVWVCVLLYSKPTFLNLIVLGVLTGSVLVLRFQLLPVIGILGLIAIVRLHASVWPALVSTVVIIVLAGLLDLWTWGGFLFSFFENLRLNFSHDISSVFGVSDLTFYSRELLRQTVGMAVIALPGIMLLWRPFWPVFVAVMIGIVALHIPGHKEFRFILWTLPFVLLAVAAGLVWVLQMPGTKIATRLLPLAVVAFWSLGAGALGFYFKEVRARPELDLRQVFLEIARDDDVTGVDLTLVNVLWWQTHGYYTLNHPVPVYFRGWHSFDPEPERTARRAHVSHLVTGPDEPPPPGYALASRVGMYQILTPTSAPERVSLLTYDFSAPLPTPADKFLGLEKRATPLEISRRFAP